MLRLTEYSLSLEGEGRVRAKGVCGYCNMPNPLTSVLSPQGRGGARA
jgi:hypothetical protein